MSIGRVYSIYNTSKICIGVDGQLRYTWQIYSRNALLQWHLQLGFTDMPLLIFLEVISILFEVIAEKAISENVRTSSKPPRGAHRPQSNGQSLWVFNYQFWNIYIPPPTPSRYFFHIICIFECHFSGIPGDWNSTQDTEVKTTQVNWFYCPITRVYSAIPIRAGYWFYDIVAGYWLGLDTTICDYHVQSNCFVHLQYE